MHLNSFQPPLKFLSYTHPKAFSVLSKATPSLSKSPESLLRLPKKKRKKKTKKKTEEFKYACNRETGYFIIKL